MAAFDVAIVGASIGGCTAARLYGLAGLRVALIERRPDPAAYKVTCTHAILSSAVPTMERVGIAPLIEARGAVRTHPAAWSPYGGWMRLPTDVPHGYGVTRQTLDPLLRQLAAETPGVELITGSTAVGLLGSDGRPAGVEIESPNRDRKTIPRKARRGSRRARFRAWRAWRGCRAACDRTTGSSTSRTGAGCPKTTRARLWFAEPNGIAVFPNEDDISVVVAGMHKAHLPEFRADPGAGLPGGRSRRSPTHRRSTMPSVCRSCSASSTCRT